MQIVWMQISQIKNIHTSSDTNLPQKHGNTNCERVFTAHFRKLDFTTAELPASSS